jgi:hypothetical protein
MGIAELAASVLANPEKDQHQPPMDEGDVRSQLYGESIAARNVLSAASRRDGGRGRDESSRRKREQGGHRPNEAGAIRPSEAGAIRGG